MGGSIGSPPKKADFPSPKEEGKSVSRLGTLSYETLVWATSRQMTIPMTITPAAMPIISHKLNGAIGAAGSTGAGVTSGCAGCASGGTTGISEGAGCASSAGSENALHAFSFKMSYFSIEFMSNLKNWPKMKPIAMSRVGTGTSYILTLHPDN